MAAIRAIFFDIGDTLVFDLLPLAARFAKALQANGIATPTDRWPLAYRAAERDALGRYLQGIPLDDPANMRLTTETALCALGGPELTDSLWLKIAGVFRELKFRRIVMPPVKPLLDALQQRGLILGAISDWDAGLPDLLTELGLRTYFDALSVSSLVGATKPNPALFQDALRQVDVSPDAALHIGDWYELDVAGARAAGMNALLFDHAGRKPDADCPRVDTFGALSAYLLNEMPPSPQ